MDLNMCFVSLLGCIFTFLLFTKKLVKSSSKLQLPPGPPGLPLIGNLFDLGHVPHQTFYNLQFKYGPVIHLKIGSTSTIVVQSPAAAAHLFKKCDIPFADRKVPQSLTALDYDQGSVAIARYGDHWRRLRRLCSAHFLVHKKINDSMSIRQNSMVGMIEMMKQEADKSGEVEVGRLLFYTMFNTIGNIMVSEEVMESKVHKAGEFFDAFVMFLEWVGKPNLGDFLPWLKCMDLQRIKRNSEKHLERLVGFASEIVEERIREKHLGKDRGKNDFLDALLEDDDNNNNNNNNNEEGPNRLSVKNITILLLEMFFGGTETTSGTVEWAMTELLRRPSSMKKIQDEIDEVVGSGRMVEENDLNHMPYLQATVQEILRLYPAIPMLLPRRAVEDTEFMGYFVPKDTQILVNAWAIHRDPSAWPDPMSFKPERFLESEIDYKGQNYEMLPFGSGRRNCLGMTLGHRMVILTLACLLQAFDWKLGEGIKADTMDMREIVGLTLRKIVPLKAIPIPRTRHY